MPLLLQNFKAEFFKALAHPVRIRLLEALRVPKCVGELQLLLNMDQSSISQQLGILRSRNLLYTRKEGTSVYYSVRDPMLFDLLDAAQAIFTNQLADTRQLLAENDLDKGLDLARSCLIKNLD